MITRVKSAFLTLLFVLTANHLFAHALWIETSSSGKVGQQQEVKVYYGEYVTNEREEVSKWYSDVKDFTLWLETPGNEKVKLSTTPGSNFFSATFTPEKDGVYFLTVSHQAKDLGGSTRYEFGALAAVAVGKATNVDHKSIPGTLSILASQVKTHKLNSAVKLIAAQQGTPAANKKVSVFSPEGWTKEFVTDAKGEITFTPLWAGRYVVEVSNYEQTSGDHNGKPYTAAWLGATSTFEVGK